MEKKTHKKGASNLVLIIAVFTCGLVIAGGAIMYGRMDNGQIDVSATILNANTEKSEAGEGTENNVQPGAAIFSTMPNGGLVGTGVPDPVATPQPSESETVATSTEGGDGAGTTTPADNTTEGTVE